MEVYSVVPPFLPNYLEVPIVSEIIFYLITFMRFQTIALSFKIHLTIATTLIRALNHTSQTGQLGEPNQANQVSQAESI